MPKIKYKDVRFRLASIDMIHKANAILEEYAEQGFTLTLRQLYYQFVARDFIPNNMKAYKNLGNVINDARLAGLIDWNAIIDRTRGLESVPHWDSPREIVDSCAKQYREDLWRDQPHRVEVWIEKDALVGVIEPVCRDLHVPFLSCRGYTSQSEMWGAAMRLASYQRDGQEPIVLHFGDHDPSGMDMSRDITDRLELFMGGVDLRRLALNMNQVRRYKPPPNPAKVTDSRYKDYLRDFGLECWELDALEPRVIADLIRKEVEGIRNAADWKRKIKAQERGRRRLIKVARTIR